jgi:hypothetical protein
MTLVSGALAGITFAMMVSVSIDPSPRCDCHEWHPVAAIGGWMVRRGGNDLIPARTWAETGGIWRASRHQQQDDAEGEEPPA